MIKYLELNKWCWKNREDIDVTTYTEGFAVIDVEVILIRQVEVDVDAYTLIRLARLIAMHFKWKASKPVLD